MSHPFTQGTDEDMQNLLNEDIENYVDLSQANRDNISEKKSVTLDHEVVNILQSQVHKDKKMDVEFQNIFDEMIVELMDPCELKLESCSQKQSTIELSKSAKGHLAMTNKKTQSIYSKKVEHFITYNKNCKGNGLGCETTLCNYIAFLRDNKYTEGSMWSVYTALNRESKVKYGVGLGKMEQLKTVLKTITHRYVTSKAKTFTKKQMRQLLDEGLLDESIPNHLEAKIGIIVSVYGLLRVGELKRLTVGNVYENFFNTNEEKPFEVTFPYETKTRVQGFSFLVPKQYRQTFHNYHFQLNDHNSPDNLLLQNFNSKGKGRSQPMGINKINKFPRMSAKLLGYDEVSCLLFTPHTWRRTAATFLADTGINITNLKRCGRWSSDACAEAYLDDTENLRKERMKRITFDQSSSEEEMQYGYKKSTRRKANAKKKTRISHYEINDSEQSEEELPNQIVLRSQTSSKSRSSVGSETNLSTAVTPFTTFDVPEANLKVSVSATDSQVILDVPKNNAGATIFNVTINITNEKK